MENNKIGFFNSATETSQQTGDMAKTFIANVFAWMFAALAITAVFAYYFAHSDLIFTLINAETGKMSMLGYVVMFAPLAFVLIMSFGYNKLPYMALMSLFLVYSAITGISLSFIFLAYTAGSIYVTFAITAGTFGLMAFLGYTTKTDLTRFGSIMMMGLIGIIIASLVNMFMKSSTMDYIISFIGVLVFTGLAAYDVQKLKRIGSGLEYGTDTTAKLSIMGALTLYLDFINLFLMLLRFFGNRRE